MKIGPLPEMWQPARVCEAVFEAIGYRVVATLLNCVFAFVPIARMAVRQTTTISDNMTAYSTAVGPSSEQRNRLMLVESSLIEASLLSSMKFMCGIAAALSKECVRFTD
jgi:hypothetical protein